MGPMPLYTSLFPTSSHPSKSVRAMFLTFFAPAGSRFPHLHNSTLGFSFQSGSPGTPFGRPEPRYVPLVHIYLLCSFYIHVLLLHICLTSGFWFECPGLHPQPLFTPSVMTSFDSAKYISLTSIPFNPLLIVSFPNHSP